MNTKADLRTAAVHASRHPKSFLRLFFALVMAGCASVCAAQRQWEGYFFNEALNVRAQLNLYADSIAVPDLDMETCYGFLRGSLNGTWVILRVKELDERRAEVRAVSDRGGDGQDLELEATDSTIVVKLAGATEMKGVKGGKYVKLPKSFELRRMGK